MPKTKKGTPALAQRIDDVLRRRGWTMRHWSIAAGLPESSHVSSIRRILLRTGNEYVGTLDTWARLAQAAGVSLDYLVFGHGIDPMEAKADEAPAASPSMPRRRAVSPSARRAPRALR